jgi:hypothetical protein
MCGIMSCNDYGKTLIQITTFCIASIFTVQGPHMEARDPHGAIAPSHLDQQSGCTAPSQLDQQSANWMHCTLPIGCTYTLPFTKKCNDLIMVTYIWLHKMEYHEQKTENWTEHKNCAKCNVMNRKLDGRKSCAKCWTVECHEQKFGWMIEDSLRIIRTSWT